LSQLIKRKLWLIFAVIFLATAVFAGETGLKISVRGKNLSSTYEAEDGEYFIKSQTGKIVTVIFGLGVFENLNAMRAVDLSEELPDADAGEFGKMKIEKIDNRRFNLNYNAFTKVVDVELITNYTLEYEIISGTWEGFEKGDELRAKLTKKGKKQSREATREIAKKTMALVLDSVKNSFELNGLKIKSKVEADGAQSVDDVIQISKTKIYSPQEWYQLDAAVEIEIEDLNPNEIVVNAQ
jgi:hypothetical protein